MHVVLPVFSNLFSPAVMSKPFIQGIDWCPISPGDGEELVAPFSLEEIRKVVFGGDRSKSSGLDGFSMALFQENYNLLKGELEIIFQEFFGRGILNHSLSETFVCLIPKERVD